MKATVVRGGQEQVIEAREIVPGDIVVVEEGQTVPADGKILAAYDDKDRSKAKTILDKREASKGGSTRSSSVEGEKKQPGDNGGQSDETKKDRDGEDEDEKKEDKGPSVFSCDQSAITGESLAVDKCMCFLSYTVQRVEMKGLAVIGDTIYYTTGAKRGKVYMVVMSTARQSFVGRTASLVTGASGQGHFQKVMNSIGTTLLVL